jgi:hypothetical protein
MIKLVHLRRTLLTQQHLRFFSEESVKLNKYFEERLKARKLMPLKDFQVEVLYKIK